MIYPTKVFMSIFNMHNRALEQGIILTGSRHDAYATDEWNLKLRELIRTAHSRQQRILGHCFGCQITTIVLGGNVGGLLLHDRSVDQQILQAFPA